MTRARLAFVALLGLAGCAHGLAAAPASSRGALRSAGIAPPADPTVLGPRLVPESIDDEKTFGAEPGGGLRAIASGVRVVSLPSGALMAADDRLPYAPNVTTVLPERLGGGFLFVIGNVVWRADRWLAPARPIFQSSLGITRVVVGLDRVYLRAPTGAHQAIDPRSGATLDLGPWPGSPFVGGYAAADGWRAVAIDDLRGVVATFDAGATWRTLDLPIDAQNVTLVTDAIAVGGLDANRATSWFEVRGDGQIGRLATPPTAAATPEKPAPLPLDGASKAFGKRPLVAAVEDGWPLGDGTAVVAREGALGRVRLSDGALIEVAPDAYPLKPSRCHPIAMARRREPGAFGFVCGEPRGATTIYAYDAAAGRLLETRRFDAPRLVIASGNGALAVRGPCAANGTEDDPATHTYCVQPKDGTWREIHVRGEIGGERVAVLADGRFAIVSPPAKGDVATARITVLDDARAQSVPVRFPALAADVLRMLKVGVWLDGFEERRPGVLGGWIEAGGSMLGIEIAVDGTARLGELVRDAGSPMISGRYGLGWTGSRRGYETIDGGMTWTPLDVPEPIAAPRQIPSRACGPIGCIAAGWLRIGWGPSQRPALPDPPPPAHYPLGRTNVSLALKCEPTSPIVTPVPPPPLPTPRRAAIGAPPTPAELPAFYTLPGPSLRVDERAITYETSELSDRAVRLGPLARVYAWGPRSGEWEHASRWIARWSWPFGASPDIRTSQAAATPPILLDVARFGTSGASGMMPPGWTVAIGDDPSHALLIARRSARTDAIVYELESDRAPVEIHRADGDPFTEIDAAVRSGGRWYLATPPQQGELMASIVWQLDGPIARELVRIPRAATDSRPTGARLARRADGRAVGLVVDGQPTADRTGPQRWVAPIDLEAGTVGDPEALGSADLGDRESIGACTGEDTGWILDAPTSSLPIALSLVGTGDTSLGALHGALARFHVTRDAACVERIAGVADSTVSDRLTAVRHPVGSRTDAASISVTVLAARSRYTLRCTR